MRSNTSELTNAPKHKEFIALLFKQTFELDLLNIRINIRIDNRISIRIRF